MRPRASPVGRWLGRAALAGTAALLFSCSGACASTGAAATGLRLARMQQSPEYRDGRFHNVLSPVESSLSEMTGKWLFEGSEHRTPAAPVAVRRRQQHELAELPASDLRVTWLGHSSTLIEIDGARLLVDPVLVGDRASPVSWAGPQRFFEPPLPLCDLPPLDAVVISHDHYDHLHYPTVLRLRDRDIRWLVPLGVGAHLEHWGVPPERIVELDWWQQTTVGDVTLTCTPARHFSGRSPVMADRNATLWAGWALRGPQHGVFFSGDTALHDDLARIGAKLGPFDLTLLDSGAYDALWADVHLGPEQAVIAHKLVRGRVMLPVHWGTFALAQHGWTEPIERVLAAAERAGVTVAAPVPGGSVEPTVAATVARWWPDLPWQTAEEAPVWSSSVGHLLGQISPR